MKILILTNNDLASLFALNLLIPKLINYQLLIGMSDKVGGNQKHPQALVDLAQFEQKQINSIITSVSTPFVTKLKKTGHLESLISFKNIGDKYQIEINKMNDINQPKGTSVVKNFKPNLILSIRFGKILQQPMIDIPTHGVINLHSGLLPQYQGVMASFWAMFNEEKYIGTCLHFISDKKIDSGEIIEQFKVLIDKNESYLNNLLGLYVSGIDMMVSAVNRLDAGEKVISQAQVGKARYYSFPDKNNLKVFFDKGYKLFDKAAN